MFESIIVAIVQGITEFLPVSSSGHVTIIASLLDIEFSLFLLVWLHASSLLAVVLYYFKDIVTLITDFFKMTLHLENDQGTIVLKLLGATTVTGVMGLFAAKAFSDFISLNIIALMLFATAGMIYLAETLRRYTKGNSFSWIQAAGVGVAQGLAVLPGLSRSGTTIAYLVGAGIERQEAVRISFLLSIPTIAGALLLGLLDGDNIEKIFTLQYLVLFIAGFISSLVSIKLMSVWVEKHWTLFIPYCLILGTGLLLI